MKRRYILGASILVLIALGIAFNYWANQPVGSKSAQANTGAVLGDTQALYTFNSPFFSSLLPETMKLKTKNEQTGKASYMFAGTNPKYGDQLAVTVSRIDGSLDEVSGVAMRAKNSETYQQINSNSSKITNGVVYERIGNTEISYFWHNSGYLYTASASGLPERKPQLQQMLRTITDNWQTPANQR